MTQPSPEEVADECFQDRTFLIGVIPSLLCLIIVITISIISIAKLRKQTDISLIIKRFYYISCIFSIITVTICVIDSYLLCTIIAIDSLTIFNDPSVRIIIRRMNYHILIECVLAILYLRVYSTFKESVYKISQWQKLILILLYALTIISECIILFVNDFNATTKGADKTIVTYIGGISYCVASGYGMYLFLTKIYTLTEPGEVSLAEHSEEIIEDALELEERQVILLRATSRYLSLLSLAIFSSWITFIQILIYPAFVDKYGPSIIGRQIIIMNYAIDCVVNIVCLYLQFTFAKVYYQKYCGCLSVCCLYMLKRKAKRDLEKRCSNMIENNKKDIKYDDDDDDYDHVVAENNDRDGDIDQENEVQDNNIIDESVHNDVNIQITVCVPASFEKNTSTAL